MDAVSRNLDQENMEPDDREGAVADLKTQLGDMQIGGGGDMLIDDYDIVDEKQDVAIITPDDSVEEPEPLADDYAAMRARIQIPTPDLEIDSEVEHTWNIENWRSLEKKVRGPRFECGGHPWRILLFPFGNNVDHASLYLEQGHEEDEKPPDGWYACVQFTLVMWNKNDPSIYLHHSAQHRFNAEESDWGFTRFGDLRKLLVAPWEDKGRTVIENEAVNVTAYVRIYKDPTGVLWHNFINYDSKKETGMVGLKNQGATCYLNSLLQSLYFTNAFRKAIYQIPTDHEPDKRNSAWALQRLFYLLQTDKDAVSTQELTVSFGWETKQIFEQQDVQELSRILMERMEERMKGTAAENALANMFVGKMKTYISCINVDYESSRIEDFWDVQLNVSGNKCLDDSFKDYIQVETMDGENKYFAEGHGLQDARKGVIFESFPQVLHLQLKRFEYDINRDAMMKVNDRYEFPEVWDASPYLSESADKSEPYIYQLHGVLVHSGDFNAGHYYAFLKPTADGHFYRFDDDRVTRATLKEALDDNFGGDYANLTNGNTGVRNPYTRTLSTKRSMSAYMLVYIRQSRLKDILFDVTEADTPEHLSRRLNEERAEKERIRKEQLEAHLYLTVDVIDDESFRAYEGFDLTSWDLDPSVLSNPRRHRVLKSSTVDDFLKSLAKERDASPEQFRFWVMVNRQNKTVRPDQPITEGSLTMEAAFSKHGSREKSFRLWLEKSDSFENGRAVWPEFAPQASSTAPILIFLKYFDVDMQQLTGVGHVYMKKSSKVADIVPLIANIMGWSQSSSRSILSGKSSDSNRSNLSNNISDNPLSPSARSPSSEKSSSTHTLIGDSISLPSLALYEEIKHSMIEPMKPKSTLSQAEIQDGDIVCFQKAVSDKEASALQSSGHYSDARDFYDYLLNRMTVSFSPKTVTDIDKEVFNLVLSRKTTYDQLAAKVADHLNVSASHLRFATVHSTNQRPKQTVKRQLNTNLWQILRPAYGGYTNSNQRDDALIYEVLEMSVTELETKKNLKVTLLSEGIAKEETFDILVPKNGSIADLFRGLQKKANLPDDLIGRMRILEVSQSKIHKELSGEASVVPIQEFATLYAEVIPDDEDNAEEGDRAIYCFHYDKEPNKPHGVPFKFVLKPGERFEDTKERLKTRTGIKGKQFEKIRFCLVQRSKFSIPVALENDDILFDKTMNADDLLGLDHVNKNRAGGAKGDSIFIR